MAGVSRALGLNGSLEELVLKNCNGISLYDLIMLGPGWMKLRKFEFRMGGLWTVHEGYDHMEIDG